MWLCSGRCVSKARLDGKVAIITGCNTGIGKYNALDFYKRGCRVIMACRDTNKAQQAKEDICRTAKALPGEPLGELLVRRLDLASLKSVRAFAQEILNEEDKIHLLINNAGIMACPKLQTEDGFDLQFGTNHLGHFLLTLLLLPRIKAAAPARIIILSSIAHRAGDMDLEDLGWEKRSYSPTGAYGRSKMANILFTRELAVRLEGSGVTVYAVHPGIVATDISRNFDGYFRGATFIFDTLARVFLKTVEQGSQTTIHCALDEAAGRETGLYYSDCRPAGVSVEASDTMTARRLWDVSLRMVGLPPDFAP